MRSARLALISFALVAITLVALTGCGTSSMPGTTSPTTKPAAKSATPTTKPSSPQKAAYLAAANAICTTMNKKIAALPDPTADAANEARRTEQTAAIIAATVRKLRALKPPPGDKAKVAAIYLKVDALLADSKVLAAAIRADSQAAGQRAEQKLQTDSDAANAASNAYGLTVCAN